MTLSEVVRLGREALQMVLLISAPVLLVALIVGTLVSLIQAVTQVHEQTLTFLPKLLAITIVLAIAGGWMIEQTIAFTARSFERITTVSS
jgi:flagellar biosynthesis protein FliQ